MHSTEVV